MTSNNKRIVYPLRGISVYKDQHVCTNNKNLTSLYSFNLFNKNFVIYKHLFHFFSEIPNLYFLFIIILQLSPVLSYRDNIDSIIMLIIMFLCTFIKNNYRYRKLRKNNKKSNAVQFSVFDKKLKEWISKTRDQILLGDLVGINTKDAKTQHGYVQAPCDLLIVALDSSKSIVVDMSCLTGRFYYEKKKALNLLLLAPVNLPINRSLEESKISIQDVNCQDQDMSTCTSLHSFRTLSSKMNVNFDNKLNLNEFSPTYLALECNDRVRDIVSLLEQSHIACNFNTHSFNGQFYTQHSDFVIHTPLEINSANVIHSGTPIHSTDWILGIALRTGSDCYPLQSNKVKYSKTILLTKKLIGIMILIQISVTALFVLLEYLWEDSNAWYLQSMDRTMSYYIWNFLMIYASTFYMVPFMAVLIIEYIYLFQSWTIEKESTEMSSQVYNPCLNDRLGQVTHLVTDKTGTLTENKLSFVKFMVNGTVYGEGVTQLSIEAARQKGCVLVDPRPLHIRASLFGFWDSGLSCKRLNFSHNKVGVDRLFHCLSLCHTAEMQQDTLRTEFVVDASLVHAASEFGFTFQARSGCTVTVSVDNGVKELSYTVVATLPFTPSRKRMSVVVESKSGRLCLLTKGSRDLLHRLAQTEVPCEIQKCIDAFSHEGLKTLVVCDKVLDYHTFSTWYTLYTEAKELTNVSERVQKLTELEDSIESNLNFLGLVGLEDRIRSDVSDTVNRLQLANIKVSMLTGDCSKLAETIGYATSILKANQIVTRIVECEYYAILGILQHTDSIQSMSLVIDGSSLNIILNDDTNTLQDLLFNYIQSCNAVIGCNLKPYDKSLFVSFMMQKLPVNTTILAVGDGMNDIPMLQTSHIGVAISSDNAIVTSSSDYTISDFKNIYKLLLVHGSQNYKRIELIFYYLFYNSFFLFWIQAFYITYNRFFADSLFRNLGSLVYNILLFCIPAISLGVHDNTILNTNYLYKFPSLYTNTSFLQMKSLLSRILYAVLHSIILLYFFLLSWIDGVTSTGKTLGLSEDRNILYITSITVSTFYLNINLNSFSNPQIMSIGIYLFIVYHFFLASNIYPLGYSYYYIQFFEDFKHYLQFFGLILLCIFCSLYINFMMRFYSLRIRPLHKFSIEDLIKLTNNINNDELCDSMLIKSDEHLIESNSTLFKNVQVTNIKMKTNILLEYQDKVVEQQYLSQNNLIFQFIIILFLILFYFIFLLFINILLGIFTYIFMHTQIIVVTLFTISLVYYRRNYFQIHIRTNVIVYFIIVLSLISIVEFQKSRLDSTLEPNLIIQFLLLILYVLKLSFKVVLIYSIISWTIIAIFLFIIPIRSWTYYDYIFYIVKFMVIIFITLLFLYKTERMQRTIFTGQLNMRQIKNITASQKKKSMKLLQNVLPKDIVQFMLTENQHLNSFSMDFHSTSILVSDIVSFTEYSTVKEPSEIVYMLNKLVTAFDHLCDRLRIEKIKTIGDAFICASGIPIYDPYHMEKIAVMGLGMLSITHQFCDSSKYYGIEHNVQIRIGIASGPARGGIIGKRKMCYEIFGKILHTAEIMEQHSTPNQIQVTLDMANHLSKSNVVSVFYRMHELYGKQAFITGDFYLAIQKLFNKMNANHIINEPLSISNFRNSYLNHSMNKSEPDHKLQLTSTLQSHSNKQINLSMQKKYTNSINAGPYLTQTSKLSSFSKVPLNQSHLNFHNPVNDLLNTDKNDIMSQWDMFTGSRSYLFLSFDYPLAENDFKEYFFKISRQDLQMEIYQGLFIFTTIYLLVGLSQSSFNNTLSYIVAAVVLFYLTFSIFLFVYYQIMDINQPAPTCTTNLSFNQSLRASMSIDKLRNQCLKSTSHLDIELAHLSISPSYLVNNSKIVRKLESELSSLSSNSSHSVNNTVTANMKYSHILNVIQLSIALVVPICVVHLSPIDSKVNIFLYVVIVTSIYLQNFYIIFIYKLFIIIITYVVWTVCFVHHFKEGELTLQTEFYYLLILTLSCIITILCGYNIENAIRETFYITKKLLVEDSKVNSAVMLCENLLTNILPTNIIHRLRQSNQQILDQIAEASVLFLYIDGLVAYEDHVPQEFICTINQVFYLLDTLSVEHNVEKIKNFPYLVVAGCPEPDDRHYIKISEYAIAVMQGIAALNDRCGKGLQVRIGIHTGNIIASVVGDTKFLYDIFGDAVNMASRLSSSADWNTIQISEDLAKKLETSVMPKFSVTYKETRDLKGKGIQRIYLLHVE